jgi:hypothetical protein
MLLKLNEPPPDSGLYVALRAVRQLLAELAEDPVVGAPADVVQRGLRGKTVQPLVPHVQALMELDADARRRLLQAFDEDADFSADLDREDPCAFAFEALEEPLRTAAAGLFLAMYTDVFRGKGFLREGDVPLDPDAFEAAFFGANATLGVCPACTRSPLERSVGRKRKKPYDIEHFFPKSAYPVLAVHPHNLVPTCMPCNQRMHRTIDPLGTGERNAISTTYVPYRRAAQDELVVHFRPVEREAAQRVELDGTCEAARRRIRTLDGIYDVSPRWGAQLDPSHTKVTQQVKLLTMVDPRGLCRASVVNALEKLAELSRGNVTQVQDSLLEAEYCDWLAGRGLRAFLAELGVD